MTPEPKCCHPNTSLAVAAELMWKNDCGILPIIDHGKLRGVITDRDICIAVGTRDQPAAAITVKEAAPAGDMHTCRPDDDITAAMAVMRRAKVRRLPAVSRDGRLEGIVGLNDLILAADRNRPDTGYDEVMNTIRIVSEHSDHQTSARHGMSVTAG
jgi:CBS domain-containing protein